MKRSTLILLVIALGLGLLVYQFEYKPGKPRDEEASTSTPAWELKAEDLASITIQQSGQPRLTLNRQESGWQITQPVVTAANGTAVDSVVSSLTSLMVEREIDSSPEQNEAYGLSTPAVLAEIKLRNGQSRKLELGSKDVLDTSVYARLDGAPRVKLLSSAILTSLQKSLNDLRDRKLLQDRFSDFSSFELVYPGGGLTLQLNEGGWSITQPSAMAAESSDIDTLLTDITTAEGLEVVSETGEDAAQFGLTQPTARFRGRLSKGGPNAERLIELAKRGADEFYARVSGKPTIFKVPSSLYEKLTTPVSKLQSRLLFSESKENLTTVQIRNSRGTTLLRRGPDGKWRIVVPTENKDQEVSTFRTIDPFETKATEIIERPEAAVLQALAKPSVEARLTTKNGASLVLRYATVGENAYGQVQGRPEVYKMPNSHVDTLTFEVKDILSGSGS